MNETGHDTESGRPERTQKMLAMTPGQTPVKKKLRLTFKEYHVAEIENDTVQYHDMLNPIAWDMFRLKPDVRGALLRVANAFIATWDLPISVTDIILTGSNANYNWTKFSDFDLHVIVDMNSVSSESSSYVASLLKSKKNLFNKSHNIRIKGYPVEVYAQNSQEVLYATGVYSLTHDRWLKEPLLVHPKFEHPAIQQRANDILTQADDALARKNEAKLREVLQKIGEIRTSGLQHGGEFDTDNLVFKVIRNSGVVQKIRDALIALMDTSLTVEDVQMFEALSSYGRYKKQRTAVRNRYKLKNARRASKRIVAGHTRLQKRTRNAALRGYYKTVLHGKKRKSLSPGEKSNMEKTFRRKYNKPNTYRKGSNVYGGVKKMQSKRRQH